MDGLTFVVRIVEALAWPAAALIAIRWLKDPVLDLVPKLGKLKWGKIEVEFSRDVKKLEAEAAVAALPPGPDVADVLKLRALAEVAPNTAVLEAFQAVREAALKRIEKVARLDGPESTPYLAIEQGLAALGDVPEKHIKMFQDLRRMRNRVAHAPSHAIGSEEALAYVEVAVRLQVALAGE